MPSLNLKINNTWTEVMRHDNSISTLIRPLGVSSGGTSLTVSPSLLTILSSTSPVSVCQTYPYLGVMGVLFILNGGTGANSLANTKTNFGIPDVPMVKNHSLSKADTSLEKSYIV